MRIKWKNLGIFIIYIILPFIYVPILNYYSIGNLELNVSHLLFIYILVQPFLVLLPLFAIGGCLVGLFCFLVDCSSFQVVRKTNQSRTRSIKT